jgi:lysyl-tRNA synthetase class 1
VPQIEKGLRSIVAQLGRPTTRPHPRVNGASLALNMGDILNDEDVVKALGPNLVLHFLAIYADPRGRNLRNDLAHGLIDANAMNEFNSRLLIHTLLVMGAWKELARSSSENSN